MSRLSKLGIEHWDEETRGAVEAGRVSGLQQASLGIMAHTPAMSKAFSALGGTLLSLTVLPQRLVELVRLRVAFHNQCRTCMAVRYQSAVDDGLTEGQVCSLERPHEAPDLSDADRAALHYADLSATNHLAISDETFDRLREHYDEREIVELGFLIAYFLGFGRLAAAWDLTEALPERFQDKSERVTPWSYEPAAVIERA